MNVNDGSDTPDFRGCPMETVKEAAMEWLKKSDYTRMSELRLRKQYKPWRIGGGKVISYLISL